MIYHTHKFLNYNIDTNEQKTEMQQRGLSLVYAGNSTVEKGEDNQK